jgi:hypothetical protein
MKILKIIGVYIFLSIACVGNPGLVMPDGGKRWTEGKKMDEATDITFAFPWVKNGKVFSQRFKTIHEDLVVYFYKSKNGEYYYLRDQMESLNVMLANEVGKENAVNFLNDKKMIDFIKDMFSDPVIGSILLTERFIEGKNADEKKILQKYNLNGKHLSVNGNDWVMKINIITKNGSVESWTVSGMVNPLAVNMFSKTLREPSGTVSGFYFIGESK